MNDALNLGVTNDGQPVFLDRANTHIRYHLLETPNLLELVREAMPQIELSSESQVVVECDMGRVVGTTNLVETTKDDEIVYAKRRGRDSYSRFAKNRRPSPCQYIVMVFRQEEGTYFLWTAMCGRILPEEAYDKESKFSHTHALAYDDNLVQIETVTIVKPQE